MSFSEEGRQSSVRVEQPWRSNPSSESLPLGRVVDIWVIRDNTLKFFFFDGILKPESRAWPSSSKSQFLRINQTCFHIITAIRTHCCQQARSNTILDHWFRILPKQIPHMLEYVGSVNHDECRTPRPCKRYRDLQQCPRAN